MAAEYFLVVAGGNPSVLVAIWPGHTVRRLRYATRMENSMGIYSLLSLKTSRMKMSLRISRLEGYDYHDGGFVAVVGADCDDDDDDDAGGDEVVYGFEREVTLV